MGPSHPLDHKPPTLSGGERQRVAIARALANEPSVLLADEPTGSLDDRAAAQISSLLAALQQDRHVTVIAVSHDARFNDAAHRILTLGDGRIATDTTR